MRLMILATLILLPQAAIADDRERPMDMEGGSRNNMRTFEAETQLSRDLLGRKLWIDPDSKIDPGSLNVELAPGSTVMIRARQHDLGTQRTKTPFYENVELPEDN